MKDIYVHYRNGDEDKYKKFGNKDKDLAFVKYRKYQIKDFTYFSIGKTKLIFEKPTAKKILEINKDVEKLIIKDMKQTKKLEKENEKLISGLKEINNLLEV